MRNGRGFTLIELLVVIAIIAILAAILFPIFSGAKKRAQMSKCINNLKQLSTGIRMYADDNCGYMPNDWPPPTYRVDWCGCVAASQWVYPEKGLIWRYTKSVEIYQCPSDIARDATNIYQSAVPKGKTRKDYPLSYAMNSAVGRRQADTLPNASKKMLLIHENRGEAKTATSTEFGQNDGAFVPNSQDVPGGVHYDGTTLSYLDGHACWKNRRELLSERVCW